MTDIGSPIENPSKIENPSTPSPVTSASAPTSSNTKSDITIRSIRESLTTTQAWSIGTAIAAILIGTFSFGTLLQSFRDDASYLAKAQAASEKIKSITAAVEDKDKKLESLSTATKDLQDKLSGTTAALRSALSLQQAITSKDKFLTRMVYYMQNGDDEDKKMLIDNVCALFRDSEKLDVRVKLEAVDVPMNKPLSATAKTYLESAGVSRSELDRVGTMVDRVVKRVSPFPSHAFDYDRDAANQVRQEAQKHPLHKSITFFDDSPYEVPLEIAVAVHSDNRCSVVSP